MAAKPIRTSLRTVSTSILIGTTVDWFRNFTVYAWIVVIMFPQKNICVNVYDTVYSYDTCFKTKTKINVMNILIQIDVHCIHKYFN